MRIILPFIHSIPYHIANMPKKSPSNLPQIIHKLIPRIFLQEFHSVAFITLRLPEIANHTPSLLIPDHNVYHLLPNHPQFQALQRRPDHDIGLRMGVLATEEQKEVLVDRDD